MRANKNFLCLIRSTGIYCMFSLLLCRLCLQECSLRNKFVGQLNLVFLWSGHLLCYKPFSRNRVSWHLLYFQNVLWSKNRSQDQFQNKVFTKTSIVLWSHYFIKILIYKPLISGLSKHLWENLIKEMVMSPFVSENIYQSLTPFFETLLNFPWLDHYWTLVQPLLLVMLD
jgi:hypothetical protein